MFRKTFQMELCRAFRPWKFLGVILAIVVLLILSDWEYTWDAVTVGYAHEIGSIEKLMMALGFDRFKCVMVILLSGLYTNSFCKDDNSHYLRFILNRVDVTTYVQCRFIANMLAVVSA